MLDVIPAINCPLGDVACVEEKMKIVEPFAARVHLDVADGKFTFNKTWGDPKQFSIFNSQFPKIEWEIHLMAEEPEQILPAWIGTGAKRVNVHIETFDAASAARMVGAAKTAGVEMMFSMNPETPAESMRQYFKLCSAFQVLAVRPGLAGQKFLPLVLYKVEFLRREVPDATIEVDGGINPETARLSREAGADIVVAASYIFDSVDPAAAYKALSEI